MRKRKEEAKLGAKVAELLQQAEQADAAEDAQYGKDKRGDELPAELERAETRRARIRTLRADLEAEARDQARDDDDAPPGGVSQPPTLPSHHIPTEKDGVTPTPKAQRNFTDAESRIMKGADGFVQGESAQAAVDAAHQIIVAQAVTNQPPDAEHFAPMLAQAIENCGQAPEHTSADNGYFSETNIAFGQANGTEPLIATGRQKHGAAPASVDGGLPAALTAKQRMAQTLATERGRKLYARRKVIVEPVFGQIKGCRGIRSFLLRGVRKVRGEWALITATHNLLKLRAVGLVPS